MFSVLLYHKLFDLKDSKYIFVEGEAHKVGDIHLPLFILKKINSDVKVRVRATMTTRIQHLKKEYLKTDDSVRQLHEATIVVSKYTGKKNAEMLHQLLDDNDYDGFTEWLLINYVSNTIPRGRRLGITTRVLTPIRYCWDYSQYDTKYRFDKMGHTYAIEVDSDDIDCCCEKLMEFFRDIDAKEVPPMEDAEATYKTVRNRISESDIGESSLES